MGLDDGSLDGDAFPLGGLVDLNNVRNNVGVGTTAVRVPAGWVLATVGLCIDSSRRSKQTLRR